MYKLMIVDDEYNIRDGLVNVISWKDYQVEVIGEAVDGRDALQKLTFLKPDIIITDIQMDNMNGLDFAEKVRIEYPQIKVVILSGFDEFEYAKRAIEMKVSAYLLKPILPNELIETISIVIKEIQDQNRIREKICSMEEELLENRRILQERLFDDLINGRISGPEELIQRSDFLNIQFAKLYYTCFVFNMDGYYELSVSRSQKELQILILSIKRIVFEILSAVMETNTFVNSSGNVISIIGQNSGKDKKVLSMIYESVDKIRESVHNILGVTVTVGCGGVLESILDIKKAYMEAERALDYKVIIGNDCVIHIDDVVSINGNRYLYPADKENKIIQSIIEQDINGIRVGLNDFFIELEEQSYQRNRLKIAVMQLYSVIARKLMDSGIDIYKIYENSLADPYVALERFDTCGEIKNWITNIVIGAVNELQKDRSNDIKSVIKKAQEYIYKHYAQSDLSLTSISEYLYLNSSYFSKLYKKETGETYVDFLTRTRLEEAKRLLKQSNIKISEVGNKVGYPNAQYFCTIFKKLLDISPAAYREDK